MMKIKVIGERVHRGVKAESECVFDISWEKDGAVLHCHGGPTGKESVKLTEERIKDLCKYGWCASVGDSDCDSLMFTAEVMHKALRQLGIFTVKSIVRRWLLASDFDGLYNESAECACGAAASCCQRC